MIFLTGASGLVGSHVLLDLLLAGHEVKALKRSSSSFSALKKLFERKKNLHLLDQVNWVEGEILDPQFLQKEIAECKHVIHCAAVVSFDPKDKELLIKTNIEGTANIVNACLSNKVEKLIHLSSTAAIGRQKKGVTINESFVWEENMKNSDYSFSKYRAELEVWRGMEEGLQVAILNPAVILGPGEWGKSSTSLFSFIWKGMRFYSTGANAFVDARDVSRAVITCVDKEIINERFLLVSENWSFKKLFGEVAVQLGRSKPNIRANKLMTAIAWRLVWVANRVLGMPATITRHTARSGRDIQVYENQKSIEGLGLDYIPVRQSIKETAEVFLLEHKS